MRRVPEPDPHVDARVPRTVLDGLHHDLPVLVSGEVGGRPRLVTKGGEGGPDPLPRRLDLAGVQEPRHLVPQRVAAVAQALEVALEGQRPEQVVGGADGKPDGPRQPLGRGRAG